MALLPWLWVGHAWSWTASQVAHGGDAGDMQEALLLCLLSRQGCLQSVLQWRRHSGACGGLRMLLGGLKCGGTMEGCCSLLAQYMCCTSVQSMGVAWLLHRRSESMSCPTHRLHCASGLGKRAAWLPLCCCKSPCALPGGELRLTCQQVGGRDQQESGCPVPGSPCHR